MKYFSALGAGLALCVLAARRILRSFTLNLRLDEVESGAWLDELTERNDD